MHNRRVRYALWSWKPITMVKSRIERILILAKTYPSPSAQYVETSCVAGINEQGLMRRLYPVPFRYIEENSQFKKWQWIEVRVEKAKKDHRHESHRLYVDTIKCGEVLDTKKKWFARMEWLEKIPNLNHIEEVNNLSHQTSLVLLRPKIVLGLEISKARNQQWTTEERDKLMREQMQDDIFSENEAKRQVSALHKIPFDFYYRYLCDTPDGEKQYHHKIVDWEAGALYWNCLRSHGPNWEKPFRDKLETDLMAKNLMFLMGNQHRFQNQWLIISMIYPPKQQPIEAIQESLF
jgi:hypothetical protein